MQILSIYAKETTFERIDSTNLKKEPCWALCCLYKSLSMQNMAREILLFDDEDILFWIFLNDFIKFFFDNFPGVQLLFLTQLFEINFSYIFFSQKNKPLVWIYIFFYFILALSRKLQELKHRSDHPTELREACPTCCVPCYYGPRNGTQFWVSGKSTIFVILNKLFLDDTWTYSNKQACWPWTIQYLSGSGGSIDTSPQKSI